VPRDELPRLLKAGALREASADEMNLDRVEVPQERSYLKAEPVPERNYGTLPIRRPTAHAGFAYQPSDAPRTSGNIKQRDPRTGQWETLT
jgi:hypothetical protein